MSEKRDGMAAIARRVPLNKTAALVTQRGPRGLESSKVLGEPCYEAPPKMRDVPETVPNLIGLSKGRLTVIGLAIRKRAKSASGSSSIWVCRCVCGRWTVRTVRALRNESNVGDACDRCQHLAHLKREAAFRATGAWPEREK